MGAAALLRNWALAYAGNFVGATATAALVFLAEQHALGGGAVGENALRIAAAKCRLGFGQAVALGALCNVLVCLAVWLCLGARGTGDRILAVFFPVTAFVACGFEHSVANMYYVPLGLLIRGFAAGAYPAAAGLEELGWGRFLAGNLLPVTIGNILGGAVMVGLVYWFVYLRPSRRTAPPCIPPDRPVD